MIKVTQQTVLSSAYLENKFALSSSTMTLGRCSPINSLRRTGRCSLFLLRTCEDSNLPSIKDR